MFPLPFFSNISHLSSLLHLPASFFLPPSPCRTSSPLPSLPPVGKAEWDTVGISDFTSLTVIPFFLDDYFFG